MNTSLLDQDIVIVTCMLGAFPYYVQYCDATAGLN